jgi:hypothetical protein
MLGLVSKRSRRHSLLFFLVWEKHFLDLFVPNSQTMLGYSHAFPILCLVVCRKNCWMDLARVD